MERMQVVDLHDRVAGGEGIEFLRAQVSLHPKTPLVIVQYSHNGEEPHYGLRLDLDKRSFLDRFDDQRKNTVLTTAIPYIAEAIEQSLNPFGAVGEVLKSQYPTVISDPLRSGIWIVPAVGGLITRAYVPMGIDAAKVAPNVIAQHINRFVTTDIGMILPPISCTWYFVMCGAGWTDDLIAEIQLQTKRHFSDDEIKVVSFAYLTWFDKRFRVSVNEENGSPGIYIVTFDPIGSQARLTQAEQAQRASTSPAVRVDTNQNPPTVAFISGDAVAQDVSQLEYHDEALRRVQGTRGQMAA